jgi:hypothetical protein
MPRSTPEVLREGTPRQPELIRLHDLIKSAPTEPEAFLLCGAQREREGKDFTEKPEECTAMDSLHTCLIRSQDEPRALVWARQGGGPWLRRLVEMKGRDQAIALGGLGVELSMAAVFRGIPDAPTVE